MNILARDNKMWLGSMDFGHGKFGRGQERTVVRSGILSLCIAAKVHATKIRRTKFCLGPYYLIYCFCLFFFFFFFLFKHWWNYFYQIANGMGFERVNHVCNLFATLHLDLFCVFFSLPLKKRENSDKWMLVYDVWLLFFEIGIWISDFSFGSAIK